MEVDYQVGQVLYLVQPDKFAVVPVQVVEQITKNTLEKNEVIYNVKVPNSLKLLRLKDFDGKIFNDINTVRHFMLENVSQSVENLIKTTISSTKEYFDIDVTTTENAPLVMPSIYESTDVIKVDLGEGIVGKVNMSSLNESGESK